MASIFSKITTNFLPNLSVKSAIIEFTVEGCPYLFFPIAGWIADTWFGRYRVILAGVYMSLVGGVLNAVATAVSYTSLHDSVIKEVLKILSNPPLVFGYSCFFANIIQFATDQMIEIGASGEELSALIHWQYWAMSLGLFVRSILRNVNIFDLERSNNSLIFSFVCLFALILSHLCFKKWLITTPLIASTLRNM